MNEPLLFLAGFLLGGLAMRYAIMRGARRQPHGSLLESGYAPARRAVMRHIKAHGTVNAAQVGQLLSVQGPVAMWYLHRLEEEGFLKSQRHPGNDGGTFYTQA